MPIRGRILGIVLVLGTLTHARFAVKEKSLNLCCPQFVVPGDGSGLTSSNLEPKGR
jgi:hypothetical protein